MKRIVVLTAAWLIPAVFALATPFPPNVANDFYSGVVNGIPTAQDNNDGVPDQFDAVNQLLGTSYTGNKDLDPRLLDWSSELDAVWTLPSGSGSVALIGLTAGNVNTLGIYTDLGVGAVQTPLLTATGFGFAGDGTVANPYPASLLAVAGSFGFYLNSASGASSATYFSESALNDGGWDHMMTFHLPELAGQTVYINTGTVEEYTFTNPYLVAWEDLPFNQVDMTLGDDDFDDMIYVFDAKPVGVPDGGNLAGMLAAAVAALLFARRRLA